MECATVACDVDEWCTVLEEKQPTARKPHKCRECKETIATGEKYNLEVTLFDGKITRYKTCLDCMSIRNEFFKEGFFYGETRWMLENHIKDCFGDISETTIKGLTPGAREVVCEMIENCWGDENE